MLYKNRSLTMELVLFFSTDHFHPEDGPHHPDATLEVVVGVGPPRHTGGPDPRMREEETGNQW